MILVNKATSVGNPTHMGSEGAANWHERHNNKMATYQYTPQRSPWKSPALLRLYFYVVSKAQTMLSISTVTYNQCLPLLIVRLITANPRHSFTSLDGPHFFTPTQSHSSDRRLLHRSIIWPAQPPSMPACPDVFVKRCAERRHWPPYEFIHK